MKLRKILRKQTVKPFTANTIKNGDQLLAELRLVRKRGFAVDNEEIEIGLRCVGAPIRDYTGCMVGAISVAAPSARLAEKRIPTIGRIVMVIAGEISEKLGYENNKTLKGNEIGVIKVEGLTQEQIHSEAQALYRAEKDHSALRPFTEKYPKIDTDEAYKIQLALIEMKKADGAKVVGKKIGLTSKAMQKMLNVDQPDYGHILDSMVLQDGAVFRVNELIQPKIEAEIAFIIPRDQRTGGYPHAGHGSHPLRRAGLGNHRQPHRRLENQAVRTIADNAPRPESCSVARPKESTSAI